ncbi:hypothetical protein [Actinomadura litoris]|uniref:Uncharacterized protein n=1 Tax=Actinomadura litoris TaxID=2678616 RepID=A0A7K1L512_9ACTN|nr:hypothetical protein [Actinomadura litoris]MUN39524.1 hypothetical protein [Actinomadura litoris]
MAEARTGRPGWAPVVYGRTRHADTWWRALPEGIDQRGWLEGVVRAAVAGGAGLHGAPRFVLARSGAHRLVGVACQAADLSDTMHSDGAREMYCFVGWVASGGPSGPPPPGPAWPQLRDSYRSWAGAVYERWMDPVWTAPLSELRWPRRSRPEPAPWPAPPPRPFSAAPPPAGAEVVPPPGWEQTWDEANDAVHPITVVLGWESMPRGAHPAGLGTVRLGVVGAPARLAPVPAPAPVPVPAPVASRPALPPRPAPPPQAPRPRPAGGTNRLVPALVGGGGLLGAVAVTVLAVGLSASGGDATGETPAPTPSPTPSATTPAPPAPVQVTVPRRGWLTLSPAPAPVADGGDVGYRNRQLFAAESSVLVMTPGAGATRERCRGLVAGRRAALSFRATPGTGFCLKTATGLAALVVDTVRDGAVTVRVTAWPL